MNEIMNLLTVEHLLKSYEGGLVEALRGVSFSIAAGESVALMGPSGCGKSTLLGLIGALDQPTGGRIMIDGKELSEHKPLHNFRARTMGFVFQFHHLVPAMTLIENVETPMIALGITKHERRERSEKLLANLGLGHRARFLPTRVSGGERQRAAVARALINNPRLILADEPTGNLDTATGEAVVTIILEHARQNSASVIIATHNPEIARKTDRIIVLRDGLVV